jgi:hypothetical protein
MPKDIDLKPASALPTSERHAKPAGADSAIDHVRAAYDIACVARSFMHDNIAPVMSAIAALSNFDSMDVGENRHRLGLIKRLANLGSELVCDAATHMESDEDDMQAKMTLLKGGAA